MTRRRVPDNWDGFDTQIHPYDEKKEKSFQSGIWIFLAVIFAGILVFITSNVLGDQRLKREGTQVAADYNRETNRASFTDEDGLYHTLNMVYYKGYKVSEDGKVTLYYLGSANDATPLNSAGEYLKHYLIFGALFGICVWRAAAALGVKFGSSRKTSL